MCCTSPELRSASSYGHFTAAKEFRPQCHILMWSELIQRLKKRKKKKTCRSSKTNHFVRLGASGLSKSYRARRELSIDVPDVTRASIYAELRPKQVPQNTKSKNTTNKYVNHKKTYHFVRFGASGLSKDHRARRELSIDVPYVTRASIYAELRPKQVQV